MLNRFQLEICTDNAAFQECEETRRYEIARILGAICDQLVHGSLSTSGVWDINGNRVGSWKLEREGD